jgi:hypothetical protein
MAAIQPEASLIGAVSTSRLTAVEDVEQLVRSDDPEHVRAQPFATIYNSEPMTTASDPCVILSQPT